MGKYVEVFEDYVKERMGVLYISLPEQLRRKVKVEKDMKVKFILIDEKTIVMKLDG